jgi:hypothetical protein
MLACPRIAPDWELAALRALMKPQLKTRIVHRRAQQKWPADAAARVAAARRLVAERLEYEPVIEFPLAGDFFLIAPVSPEQFTHALAFAVVLSGALPGLWISVGRIYVLDRQFFRRKRGVKLDLVHAGNVHLARTHRTALRGLV